LLIRKEKIIGLQVYDKKGRFVGTVKDIGFVLGENLVGIVVSGRDNREMEFIWSEVEAAEDIVILKKEVTIPVTAPPPKKAAVETREEAKTAVKEQLSTSPPTQVEKPQPLAIGREAEVQVASKSGIGGVSELQPSFKEPADYGNISLDHGGAASPEFQPGLEEPEKTEEETVSTTKTCPKCGAINNARYKFCFRCGTRLPA
jgi:sporulation protein YlmC with PRC-barrel domain/ribosomal protein L40E